MEAQLNSGIFPVVKVGMYETQLDPRHFFDWDLMDNDCEDGDTFFTQHFMYYYFDNQKYKDWIAKKAQEYIDDVVEIPFITLIKVGQVHSPREYNFRTDTLDLIVEYDKIGVLGYLRENEEAFRKYLKDNFTSYDGFMSFTANNWDDWKEDYNQDREQEIGAALTFIMENEEHEEYFDWYASEDSPHIEEFLTDEGEELMGMIQGTVDATIKQGYGDGREPWEIISMVQNNIAEWESQYSDKYFNVDAYVKQQIKEIDEQTPKLF